MLKELGKIIVSNKKTIAIGLATIAGAVLTVKSTVKAVDKFEEIKKEKDKIDATIEEVRVMASEEEYSETDYENDKMISANKAIVKRVIACLTPIGYFGIALWSTKRLAKELPLNNIWKYLRQLLFRENIHYGVEVI